MQTQEDKSAYERTVEKTCLYSNLIFLLTHIGYLIFFLITEIYLLAWCDLGSVAIYAVLLIFVKKKKYNVYAITVGVEITAFMSFATAVCGFQTGFHLCIIGLCILAYYSGYFSENKTKIIKPVYWCIMLMSVYIFLYFYCINNAPLYDLSIVVKSILFVVHAVTVFGFITIFLHVFVRYVVKLEKRIINESRTDKLTQVANRYGLIDYIDSLDDKNNYYLSIFDIDDFKVVNDDYGHICGDHMLVEIANLAKIHLNDDFIARFGGEEFIVITKADDNYKERMDSLRKKIEDHVFEFDGINIHATITIGVAQYEDGMNLDDWVMKADKKLYDGKTSGKNKVVF